MPGPSLSGGVKCTRLLGEALVRRGHEVRLCYTAVGRRRAPLWRVDQIVKAWGATLLDPGQPHHLERSTAQLVPVRKRAIGAEDVPDADVSISTWWETREWIEGWPASKGMKAYYIQHYELFGGEEERVRATYRMGGMQIVISEWLRRLMETEFGRPDAVLVRNGLEKDRFDAPARGRQPAPTVGMMYSSTKWKGAETALAALGRVQERLPRLRVIAFGAEEPPAGAGVPRNFEYHRTPAQSEIPELCRRCDVWLLPSVSEGFGMPGLEAAACRCPVVATRCGGPEEYVEDGRSGYLVPVGDAGEMASRLVDVLTAPEAQWRRMSDASYEIAQRFDWDRSAAVLEAALAAEVERGRSGAGTAGVVVGR